MLAFGVGAVVAAVLFGPVAYHMGYRNGRAAARTSRLAHQATPPAGTRLLTRKHNTHRRRRSMLNAGSRAPWWAPPITRPGRRARLK